MSDRKRKILILVEGEKLDVQLMEKLFSVYGIDDRHELVSYRTNIYQLYRELFIDDDPESMDLLQVLKSREQDLEKKKIFDESYTDILLVFDFDPQDHLYSAEKIIKMVSYFTESSDMGKLYINYPMVESFYHMKEIPDPSYPACFVSMQELANKQYKARVNRESRNPDYRQFAKDKNECNIVIRQNIDKAWDLFDKRISEAVLPEMPEILQKQIELLEEKQTIAVLCTSAFYIVDYNPKLILVD